MLPVGVLLSRFCPAFHLPSCDLPRSLCTYVEQIKITHDLGLASVVAENYLRDQKNIFTCETNLAYLRDKKSLS